MYYSDTEAYSSALFTHYALLVLSIALVIAAIVTLVVMLRSKKTKKRYALVTVLFAAAALSGVFSQTVFSHPRCCGEGYTYWSTTKQS